MSPLTKSSENWSRWHIQLQKTLINKSNLLPNGSSLLLAISGGQDSMALVKLILDLQRLYDWEIAIWHGDHGWHSQSKQIAIELQNWCENNSLKFVCEKAKKGELKSEEDARTWRYKQLIEYAQGLSSQNNESNPYRVLTGHTGSDRAETFLIHLARGAHLRGLGSLRYARKLNEQVKLIRPLLGFSRKDTGQFCKEMELPIWIDPTNENPAFTRNRIRQEIIPVFEELHPGASLRIGSLSEKLSQLNDDQESLSKLLIQEVKFSDGLSREKLLPLTIHARATILAEWLKRFEIPTIKASQLEEISHKTAATKSPGKYHLGKGWEIEWNTKIIRVSHRNN